VHDLRRLAAEEASARTVTQNGVYYDDGMQTISLRLPEELLARVDMEARARGITKSLLVRESLERALREEGSTRAVSCYDLARDLAGSVKRLPADLAGNPQYMENFGR
jgi:predicted DNA-binding protein